MLVAGGVAVTLAPGLLAPSEYERTTVTVADEDGTTLATVDVRIADTSRKRYVGLSATDSLDDDEGMLFVHDAPGQYAYVMRDMAFPLDILFVAPNGTVTRVHHAELPPPNTPESALERYRGRGQYVLEVPYGYTNRTGVTVGDTLSWPGRAAE
ncbi:DUF192 domain-containing protein [Halobaculum sp. MBLA0147]|uniref:DUF192 domain-containing protein n=1 Tax=Halobaculum sp. MBLA0147 TaxID=3079934 RepID=UPI0035255199